MKINSVGWIMLALMASLLPACTSASTAGPSGTTEATGTTKADLQVATTRDSVSFEFSSVTYLPVELAAGQQLYFIGDPLEGRVFAYSRFTNKQVGELPQPPGGFVVPFILHELGEGRVAIRN